MTLFLQKIRLFRNRKSTALYRILFVLLILFVCLLVARVLLLDIRPVQGHSMLPTLREGEWVLVLKPAYLLSAPKYGEVVAFHPVSGDEDWIKRVVGLPGDVLSAQGGQVYRNGESIKEPYLAKETPDFSSVKAWDGEYLLLGDHREDSLDSRLPHVGAVPHEDIIGHAIFVIWPPAAWRSL